MATTKQGIEGRLVWTLVCGAALHLTLSLSPLPAILVDRNELTTPITSWTRRAFPVLLSLTTDH